MEYLKININVRNIYLLLNKLERLLRQSRFVKKTETRRVTAKAEERMRRRL